jgi:16S rRNA (uracil1498-N3)-methyltransferase
MCSPHAFLFFLCTMQMLFHPENISDNFFTPNEEEQRHIRALRLKNGEHVLVSDGKGTILTCIVHEEKKQTSLEIHSSQFYPKSENTLHIAIAPTKNTDRLEWFVEKAVEIGIDKISIIKCDHSERAILKSERLLRVAIAALKQSRKAWLPEISELIEWNSLLPSISENVKCIAHCADDSDKKLLKNILVQGQSACIAIGPEGDFSPKEIETARQHGFIAVSLGEARLRTETAGLAAVHTYQLIQQ